MGAGVIASGGDQPHFEAKVTFTVILCAIIAAFGGLMFGYDIGVSGGITSMDDFLKKFFDDVYIRKQHVVENNYCKYDSQKLQLFTSSLYIAALIASFFASKSCTKFGRRPTMQLASLFFLAGVVLTTAAQDLAMLIVGRVLLGLGVGFANQAVPLFLSEIAPTKIRGALNICFQLMVTIGILIANVINYFTGKSHPNGYRISLGIAAGPALVLFLGSLMIVETPTSLIEREKYEEARIVLKKIRGVDNVDSEFDSIVRACDIGRKVSSPFRMLLTRPSIPPLFNGIVLQIFQQFTGINAIMFYSPVLFQTIGFGSDASLLSAVVTGGVNVLCTVVSVVAVDRAGRRFLLLEAAVQMLITQVLIGALLMHDLKPQGSLADGESIVVVLLVCIFVGGFAWSWGPLGWLIPSETFPVETRSAGYSFAVCSNMMFTFVIAQSFLSMLCTMRAGIFFFFAAWIVVMGLYAFFMLPETKGINMESVVEQVWMPHWFWGRFFDRNGDIEMNQSKAVADPRTV